MTPAEEEAPASTGLPASAGAPASTGLPASAGAPASAGVPVPVSTEAPAVDGTGIWHLVDVEDVAVTLPSNFPEVVLRERQAPFRCLRVPVGLAEGTAIAYAWRRQPTPRPLTHELFADVLDRHDVRIVAVRLTAVEAGLFHAELDTTSRIGRQVVPCRTSDAIALALRQRPSVPILVAEWVFAQPDGTSPPG